MYFPRLEQLLQENFINKEEYVVLLSMKDAEERGKQLLKYHALFDSEQKLQQELRKMNITNSTKEERMKKKLAIQMEQKKRILMMITVNHILNSLMEKQYIHFKDVYLNNIQDQELFLTEKGKRLFA